MNGKHNGTLSGEECEVVVDLLEGKNNTSNVHSVIGKEGRYVEADIEKNGLRGKFIVNDLSDDFRDGIGE